MKKMNVAIFGAGSHIAKGLIVNFLNSGEVMLHLYTRSPEKALKFIKSLNRKQDKDCVIHSDYKDLFEGTHDVIINCVGIGTISKVKEYSEYFTVFEEYDNLAIKYLLSGHADTLYVGMSSGAVYGRNLTEPAKENNFNPIPVNDLPPEDYYSIVKIYSEAKHRSYKDLKIIDLRIFAYYSKFIDLKDGYFIAEVLNSVMKNKVFRTDGVNFVRDYLHPDDLFSMVTKCMHAGKLNTAFDVTSSKPVKKMEILDHFSTVYGLKYEIVGSIGRASMTGEKKIYCSNFKNASTVGYVPRYSSLETIMKVSKEMINDRRK